MPPRRNESIQKWKECKTEDRLRKDECFEGCFWEPHCRKLAHTRDMEEGYHRLLKNPPEWSVEPRMGKWAIYKYGLMLSTRDTKEEAYIEMERLKNNIEELKRRNKQQKAKKTTMLDRAVRMVRG